MSAGDARPAAGEDGVLPLQRLGDADHALRLGGFRADHPEWVIGSGEGYWQARRPEGSGEIVITDYTLGDLLDRLDGLDGELDDTG